MKSRQPVKKVVVLEVIKDCPEPVKRPISRQHARFFYQTCHENNDSQYEAKTEIIIPQVKSYYDII